MCFCTGILIDVGRKRSDITKTALSEDSKQRVCLFQNRDNLIASRTIVCA